MLVCFDKTEILRMHVHVRLTNFILSRTYKNLFLTYPTRILPELAMHGGRTMHICAYDAIRECIHGAYTRPDGNQYAYIRYAP